MLGGHLAFPVPVLLVIIGHASGHLAKQGVPVEAETSHIQVIGMGKILKWESRAVMRLSDIRGELRGNFPSSADF